MASPGFGPTVSHACAASQTDTDWLTTQADSAGDLPESALPRDFRNRLHKMFERIERDFEREYQKLCAENFARKPIHIENGSNALKPLTVYTKREIYYGNEDMPWSIFMLVFLLCLSSECIG